MHRPVVLFVYIVLTTLLLSFTRVEGASLEPGIWLAKLTTHSGNEIPFGMHVKRTGENTVVEVLNATERLVIDKISYRGDSIFFTMPFFDSEIRVERSGGQMNGYWIRHLPGRDLRTSFSAKMGTEERFPSSEPAKGNVSGTWDLSFKQAVHHAVGVFQQDKRGVVTGSILNVDGDYRYLEGRMSGDSLFLSTFDGAHAYLFKSKYNRASGLLEGGKMYAGGSGYDEWTGKLDPAAKLPDPYSLTTLREGYRSINFAFRDTKGRTVSLSDPKFKNKIVILQFMGSWCPNCMDETAFLSKFYDKYKSDVAVIGLAYERTSNFDSSRTSLQSFIKGFDVHYDILITGYTPTPAQVLKSIPALKNYMAFPTTMILDKKGLVNSIHTGFAGPGTAKYYEAFTEEFTNKIEGLINQK